MFESRGGENQAEEESDATAGAASGSERRPVWQRRRRPVSLVAEERKRVSLFASKEEKRDESNAAAGSSFSLVSPTTLWTEQRVRRGGQSDGAVAHVRRGGKPFPRLFRPEKETLSLLGLSTNERKVQNPYCFCWEERPWPAFLSQFFSKKSISSDPHTPFLILALPYLFVFFLCFGLKFFL